MRKICIPHNVHRVSYFAWRKKKQKKKKQMTEWVVGCVLCVLLPFGHSMHGFVYTTAVLLCFFFRTFSCRFAKMCSADKRPASNGPCTHGDGQCARMGHTRHSMSTDIIGQLIIQSTHFLALRYAWILSEICELYLCTCVCVRVECVEFMRIYWMMNGYNFQMAMGCLLIISSYSTVGSCTYRINRWQRCGDKQKLENLFSMSVLPCVRPTTIKWRLANTSFGSFLCLIFDLCSRSHLIYLFSHLMSCCVWKSV